MLIGTGDLVAGAPGQDCNAAHERAAGTKDVNLHSNFLGCCIFKQVKKLPPHTRKTGESRFAGFMCKSQVNIL
jgi:hypothetical protein